MEERYYELVEDYEDYGVISWDIDYRSKSKVEIAKSIIQTLECSIDTLSNKYSPSSILHWIKELKRDIESDFVCGIFNNLQKRLKTLEELKTKAYTLGVGDALEKILYKDNEFDGYFLYVFPFDEQLTSHFGGNYKDWLFNKIKLVDATLAYKLYNDKGMITARIEELKKLNKNFESTIKDYEKHIKRNNEEISNLEKIEKELQNEQSTDSN